MLSADFWTPTTYFFLQALRVIELLTKISIFCAQGALHNGCIRSYSLTKSSNEIEFRLAEVCWRQVQHCFKCLKTSCRQWSCCVTCRKAVGANCGVLERGRGVLVCLENDALSLQHEMWWGNGVEQRTRGKGRTYRAWFLPSEMFQSAVLSYILFMQWMPGGA